MLFSQLLNKQNEKWGAVVPIAGAVVGTVSTMNQMSAQRRAAEQQRQGLIAQEQAASRNLQLSLQEIERQRMYAGAHAQLQEQARLNNLAFQQNESLINRQEAQLEMAQAQIAAQMQNSQAQANATRGQAGVNQQLDQGNIQRDMQFAGDQAQRGIQTRSVGGRQFGEAANDIAGYEQLLQGEQAQVNTGMEGLIGQYAQGQVQAGMNDVSANQQAVQGSQELRNMALEGDMRQQQGNEQLSQMRQQLGQGGISSSDVAQLERGSNQIAQEAIQRRMMMNQGASDIAANLQLSQGMNNFQRGQVDRGFARGTRDLVNQAMMQRGAVQTQMGLNEYGRGLESSGLMAQNQLAGFMGKQARDQGNMFQGQSAALQNQQLVQGAQLAQSVSDYEVLKASLDAGLSDQALDILEHARLQRHELETSTSQLNQLFSDMAMSQQAFSQVNAGQAEQAALRAQQGAVQASKPGFLSFASALGQGALGINEAMYRPPTLQQPSQAGFVSQLPQFQQSTNYTPAGAFTNASQYSFQRN